MIKDFIDRYEQNKDKIRNEFILKHYDSYEEIVKMIISHMFDQTDYGVPDISKLHTIDDGEYQGTLLFILPENCYQPDKYWITKVSYGSCSNCDTLRAINNDYDNIPTDQNVEDYMMLVLHLIQQFKELD